MNNFENLQFLPLKPDLLMKIVQTYKFIGVNETYREKFKSNYDQIIEDNFEKDVYFLSLLSGTQLSESRLEALIIKDVLPKNKEEQQILNIKKVLETINRRADQYLFNASDLLEFINTIYGKNHAKYLNTMIPGDRMRNIPTRSVRYLFDTVIDQYQQLFTQNKYEKILLSLLTYVELLNIKPYSQGNEFASCLALYYMLRRSEVDCFRYVSFFESFYHNIDKIQRAVIEASVSYTDNNIKLTTLASLIFELILDGYQDVEKFKNNYHHFELQGKIVLVQKTILQFQGVFTKDDIKKIHPLISDSTISRALKVLREQDYIRALSVGRSAKWIRNPEKEVKISQLIG